MRIEILDQFWRATLAQVKRHRKFTSLPLEAVGGEGNGGMTSFAGYRLRIRSVGHRAPLRLCILAIACSLVLLVEGVIGHGDIVLAQRVQLVLRLLLGGEVLVAAGGVGIPPRQRRGGGADSVSRDPASSWQAEKTRCGYDDEIAVTTIQLRTLIQLLPRLRAVAGRYTQADPIGPAIHAAPPSTTP